MGMLSIRWDPAVPWACPALFPGRTHLSPAKVRYTILLNINITVSGYITFSKTTVEVNCCSSDLTVAWINGISHQKASASVIRRASAKTNRKCWIRSFRLRHLVNTVHTVIGLDNLASVTWRHCLSLCSTQARIDHVPHFQMLLLRWRAYTPRRIEDTERVFLV